MVNALLSLDRLDYKDNHSDNDDCNDWEGDPEAFHVAI